MPSKAITILRVNRKSEQFLSCLINMCHVSVVKWLRREYRSIGSARDRDTAVWSYSCVGGLQLRWCCNCVWRIAVLVRLQLCGDCNYVGATAVCRLKLCVAEAVCGCSCVWAISVWRLQLYGCCICVWATAVERCSCLSPWHPNPVLL